MSNYVFTAIFAAIPSPPLFVSLVYLSYHATHTTPAERRVEQFLFFKLQVLLGKMSNYDIDVFTAIFAAIRAVTPGLRAYTGMVGEEEDPERIDMAYRVVADHIRTLTISITDGAQVLTIDLSCLPLGSPLQYVYSSILLVFYGIQSRRRPHPHPHNIHHRRRAGAHPISRFHTPYITRYCVSIQRLLFSLSISYRVIVGRIRNPHNINRVRRTGAHYRYILPTLYLGFLPLGAHPISVISTPRWPTLCA